MKTAARFLTALWLLAVAVVAEPRFPIPESSLQTVVVLSSGWDDPYATMHRFERASSRGPWTSVGATVPVSLGRTGLAWGRSGLIEDVSSGSGPHKKEGDGKSPAGLFPLLSAFGHPIAPKGYSAKNLPFEAVDKHQCVDDGKSRYYNQIVEPAKVGGKSWDSAETMKIEVYRMGLVVGHNCKNEPGLGSCIFFHLRDHVKDTTAGCTAMERAPLTELLLWLRRDAEPVVLQLPRQQFLDQHHPSWPKITK